MRILPEPLGGRCDPDFGEQVDGARPRGPAALAGVNTRPLEGPRGQYDAATLEAGIRPDFRHFPKSRLVWVEQTSNLGGGSVWPLDRVRAVTEVARRHRLATHLDGARLMNAVVASGVSAREWASHFDSVWIDFTKGLGAPVGAALAGSRAFIEEAWRYKQQMGGAMRQAGIAMFHSFDAPVWDRRGRANNVEFTVRSVAFIIAGHELHHRGVIESRYLG